jgi:hypothetical protein
MSRIDWASEDAARLAQHEIDGAREGLAPRLECNDPARVVVLSDQREPRDSCSAHLLDNTVRRFTNNRSNPDTREFGGNFANG